MFREGMGLVEETASYLDREGRRESKRLSRAGSLSYAAESMRLTTRLMQLASWLLLQRAVNEGDISAEQARHERAKVKLGGVSSATDGPGWDDLPERLRELIDRSLRLQDRVIRLDTALRQEPRRRRRQPDRARPRPHRRGLRRPQIAPQKAKPRPKPGLERPPETLVSGLSCRPSGPCSAT